MANHSERHAIPFHTPLMEYVWIESRQARGILLEVTQSGQARVTTCLRWYEDVDFYSQSDILELTDEHRAVPTFQRPEQPGLFEAHALRNARN